jgi:hypothetical protein
LLNCATVPEKHDRASRRVLLHDREIVLLGEIHHRGHVARRRAEFVGELHVRHATARSRARGKARDLFLERTGILAAYQHGHLEALCRIGFSDGPRPCERLPVTASQNIFRHD